MALITGNTGGASFEIIAMAGRAIGGRVVQAGFMFDAVDICGVIRGSAAAGIIGTV
jgi:hypothetical protein